MSLIRFVGIVSIAVLASLPQGYAWGQDYPVKSIRFVVANAPGGGTDLMARVIAQKLHEAWGQPVVVDNRPGGTGAVGSVLVAKSAPDGYTLLIVTNSSHAIAPSLQKDLAYHPVNDFAPIAIVATGPNMLVAHPSVAANTVKELVALAIARPEAFNYASPGTGTVAHMAMELFKTVTRTNIVHVPYKGSADAVTGLLSGQVQLTFSGPGSVIQHVHAKRLKMLAVAAPRRSAGLEDIPTFAEAGYPAVEASSWYGVLTTAGTPQTVVAKLNREIVRIMELPDVRKRFSSQGYEPASSTPQQFMQLIRTDLAMWSRVVKASGLRSD